MLPEGKRLPREALLSLAIHGCFQIGFAMSMIFLNLYLWRLTESLLVIALYNGIQFFVLALVFLCAGWWAKKKNCIVIYRLGILFNTLFYLFVFLAKQNVADYYYLFAVLSAFGIGFYFAGYFTIVYDVTNHENRLRYMGLQSVIGNLSQMLGPVLAGVVISQFEELTGYAIVFCVVYLLFTAAFIGSFSIRVNTTHHKAYYIKLTNLIMSRYPKWKGALYGYYYVGLLEGTLIFLPPILLYSVFGREDVVGYVNFFLFSVSMLTSFMMSRYARNNRIIRYLVMTSSFFCVGASALIPGISIYSVIAFMMLVSIAKPLHRNFLQAYFFRTVDQLPLKGHLKVESIVLMEVFLNMGRVTSAFAIALLAGKLQGEILVIILILSSILQFVIIGLLRKSHSPLYKNLNITR
jgi:YQGE family putative transporter